MPVSQYSVMLSSTWSRVRPPVAIPLNEGARDLVVAVRVVVEHPGRQSDGGIQQGVANRLRPRGLLQEVAKAARPEGGKRVNSPLVPPRFPSGGRRHPARSRAELVWMPTSPAGACGPSYR